MSVVSAPPGAPWLPDLAALAAVAGRAVSAATVLIVLYPPAGPSLVGAVGLLGDEAPELVDALTELRDHFAPRDSFSLASLAGLELPGVGVLTDNGYAAVLGTGLHASEDLCGAIFALRREAGGFRDDHLMISLARQAAIAVSHRHLGETLQPSPEGVAPLDGLAELALEANDFEEIVQALNRRIAPVLGSEMTAIMVWDEQRQVLQLVAGSFGASAKVAASYQINIANCRSNAARVFTTGQPYMSNHAAGDPGILQDYVHALRVDRVVSVPLRLTDRSVGVLHVANKRTDFTVEDVEWIKGVAPRIATLVEVARTLFKLRRQRRLEGILSHVAVSVASGDNVHDFLSPALEQLAVATEASLLALVIDGSSPIIHRAVSGYEELERVVLEEAAAKPGMRAYVVGPREAGDPGWAAFHNPITLGGQRLGTLAALRVRGEPFSRDERHAMGRLANLAALAWASERYQQQRAELARLEERHRIADDLHDDVAQILFGAQLQLDQILEHGELDAATVAGISRARGLLIRGDSAIRTVIHQLSRRAQADLGERLTSIVSGVQAEFSLPIHLEISADAAQASRRLSKAAADALAKVARESLVNASKHAGPCRAGVSLNLTRDGRLMVAVVDDGVGLARSSQARRHGLVSLRRAVDAQGGCLRLRKGPTGGTKITASVPL